MQHIDRVVELRHIQHSECSRGIANPNFLYPSTHGSHGLPVIRFTAMLHLIELMPRLTSGCFRKSAQIVERSASKLDGLGIDQ